MLRRVLPIALAIAGIVFSVRTGGKAVEVARDMVKAVMTRTELSSIARTLSTTMDARAAAKLHRDEARWERFLREDALTSRAGRDTATDLWETPFELVRDGGEYRVRSLGPNLAQDFACDDGVEGGGLGDPDTLLARLGWKTDAVAEAEDGSAIIGDDDMCVDVAFTPETTNRPSRNERIDRLFR